MKKLTQFAINYPVTVVMIVLGIVLLGIISFTKLGVDLFPDLSTPRIYIELQSSESPPEEMEENFIEDMEATAIRQENVVGVSTVMETGSAQMIVEYKWNTDMDEAFLNLQKALNTYSQSVDNMQMGQYDPDLDPVMIVGLKREDMTDMNELRKVAENYIRNELVRLDGVAEVELSGQEEKQVLIQTDPYKLKAFGFTLDNLSSQISNFNRSISGGSISEMGTQYTVKGVSMLTGVTDFENLILGYQPVVTTSAQGVTVERAPIYLKDVASVSFANKDPENVVRINGVRCIGLSIYKETKYNTIKAVNEINAALDDLRRALPGYELTVVSNQGSYITSAISDLEKSGLVGIVLVIFVLLLFLRRIETTLIVASAIPVAIIASFSIMYFSDLSLNIMTLGGLALAAGLLVSNSVVVLESILRHHDAGMSAKDAAIEGTSEVGGAIISSTLAIIIVFLPVIFLEGAAGELYKHEALTVGFSLIIALLAAVFLIPMLYHLLFRNRQAPVARTSMRFQGYGNFLEKVLRRKGLVIILTLIFVAGSFALIPFMGSEFMPKTKSKDLTVNIKLLEGTKLSRTESTARSIASILTNNLGEDIDMIYSVAGSTSGTSISEGSALEGDNTAKIRIRLSEESNRTPDDLITLINSLTDSVEGMEVTYSREVTALGSILGRARTPVAVEVRGSDFDQIKLITDEVYQRLAGMKELYNVESSVADGPPEVHIMIDQYRSGIYSISPSTIVTQLQNQLEGQNAGQIENEGEMNDITLKIPEKSLADLSELTITSGTNTYRLDELASITTRVSPKQVLRNNQVRYGKVTAGISSKLPVNKVAKNIRQSLSDISLPSGYQIIVTGEEALRMESIGNLKIAFILAVVLIYMLLAAQFESLTHPLTVILTVPLAVAGSLITFFILGKAINIIALIGIILLVGISVNNSIVLVDRINQLAGNGLDLRKAIISAGQQRIRPVIMSSLTTIAAIIPLIFGTGESVVLRSSMALAVVGGLITATILTLIVTPCLYELFVTQNGKGT